MTFILFFFIFVCTNSRLSNFAGLAPAGVPLEQEVLGSICWSGKALWSFSFKNCLVVVVELHRTYKHNWRNVSVLLSKLTLN